MTKIFIDDEYYTISEIAKILKVSEDGVRRMIVRADIRKYRIGHGLKGRIRILGIDVRKLLNEEIHPMTQRMNQNNAHLMKSAWRSCLNFEDYLDKVRKAKLN